MSSMVLLSFRNMNSNRLRFLLTTLAVLLGVSFVVASFVLTDGLRATFSTIVADANVGLDAQVQATSEFDETFSTQRPIDESVVEVVAAVDGVNMAVPGTESLKIVPVTDAGPIETTGAPILSYNWEGSSLSPLTLVEGEIPDGPGEFAIDVTTAENENMVVGNTYDMIGINGAEPFELVGINRFGEDNVLGGAVLLSFQLEELQRLDGTEGLIEWISIDGAPELSNEELLHALSRRHCPLTWRSSPVTAVIAEDQDEFGSVIDIFGNVLLAFALVTVFVSTFIIANTFNILLGQRVRQLSLLRALGASSRQVRFGAMFEAFIIGVVASVLGIGGGVLLALGLRGVMNLLGFDLPGLELIVSTQTIVVALVVGVGVTLMAALSPARRAAGIPPMAGIRAGYRFGSGEGTRRTIIAIVLAVIGTGAMGYGLFGGSDNTGLLLSVLGLGAVLVFVAVSMFTPLFSTPSASALGIPLEHIPGRQITGHMARQNAAGNNKRTATTAAGLMIGLALIAMATVVATSLKASFRETLGSTLTADYLVTAPNGGEFSNRVVDQIAALPEVGDISAVRYGTIRIDGVDKGVAATDFTVLTNLLDVGVRSGDPVTAADPGHILLQRDVADERGLSVGDSVGVEFAATGTTDLEVGAIFDSAFLVNDYLIDVSAWDAYFDNINDNTIALKAAPGVEPEVVGAALQPLESAFPQLAFQTREEFRVDIEGQLDSILVVINVLLGLAIIIALLGIANTMALSVLERTQELGLMRAIGMTRRQTRSLIRLEAGVVSLFGAILGIIVGVAFGWLAVIAIPDSFIGQVSIPAATLAVYAVIATIAGLVAASFPARRAARLNILDAITEL